MATVRLDSPKDAHVVTYETWGDFTRDAAKPSTTGWQSARVTGSSRGDWSGARSLDDALDMATHGWKQGEERMREIARRIEVRLLHRIVREDVNYDVEGISFDVARYLDGEPEHWVRMEESTMQEDSHRHVKLVSNTAVSCGVSTETIMARGAAIAALVELLEYAGHRVELWVASTSSDSPDGPAIFQAYVRVKAYDQPIDPARVCYALIQPSFQRRLCFSLMEQAPRGIAQRLSSHYGYPTDAPSDVQDGAGLYLGKAGLWEDFTHTPEAIEAWVIAQLARQGVMLRDED